MLDQDDKSGTQRIRKPEAVYSCEFCPMTFSRIRHFNAHRATHTGERATLPCNICQQEFTDINELKDHKKSQHPGTVMVLNKVLSCPHLNMISIIHDFRFTNAHCATNPSSKRRPCNDIRHPTRKNLLQNQIFPVNIVTRNLLQWQLELYTKEPTRGSARSSALHALKALHLR